MKKRMIGICAFSAFLLLMGGSIQAQKVEVKKADEKYEQLAYIDAIKIYERLASKGYANADMLMKLADSYYFNGKLIDANKWYNELFNGKYKDKGKVGIPSEYYYRYAQTLKASGHYDISAQIMDKFVALEREDSRAKLYVANKDYLETIEDKTDLYKVTNLPINSVYSDYSVAIFDNQFVFTSARPATKQIYKKAVHDWTNESYTTLFSSTLGADGSLSEPVVFSPDISSQLNDATLIFSKDGKTVYFTRNSAAKAKNPNNNIVDSAIVKIYSAKKLSNGKWGDVKELPINSDDHNTAHPALSPDGKWLYFSSDREGGEGMSDIYRVRILSEDMYGATESVGENINTAGRDNFPFISEDNYLFFSSDGHPGLGGLDVFRAKLEEDGSFGEVINVGAPMNSPLDDFAVYLNADLHSGYFASNRVGGVGGDDIYSFSDYSFPTGKCLFDLSGTVYDIGTNAGLADATVTLSDALYAESVTIEAGANGGYLFEHTECKDKYRLRAAVDGYSTAEVVFSHDQLNDSKVYNIGLTKTTEIVQVNDDLFKMLNLAPIYFDYNKSDIREDAIAELIKVVEVMKEYPTMKVDVRSHTDSRGDDKYNLLLSDRRVQATIKWMVSQGIEKERLTGRGYGETQIQNGCTNGVPCTEAEHQMNRRSEFIVTEL